MSSLVDHLDKGASLGRDEPCLVEDGRTLSYGEVQDLSWAVARALAQSGVEPGGKVGILSSNDAVAFALVFGIARRGAVWCPINPRNEAAENRALLELFDCECLLYHSAYAEMVERSWREFFTPGVLLWLASSSAGSRMRRPPRSSRPTHPATSRCSSGRAARPGCRRA
jgi:acyl-CoA synthetase (AMP-forming)/AMP-acid ligase II